MHSLTAHGIAVVVDPADGGRIVSLRAHGREWLAASSPRLPQESFVAAGTGGWDEVAPTVRECESPSGVQLRDHGDAWRTAWTVEEATLSQLTMSTHLASVGVELRRVIRASAAGLRFEYRATTASVEPIPLLWCAHPLFDASDGARIVASGTLIEEYPMRGSAVAWPESVTAGRALKAFASGISEAAVVHERGALRMTWDLQQAGFYWDGGEFSERPVIAIEPSTGASDSADLVWNELPTVSTDEPLEWWLELTL